MYIDLGKQNIALAGAKDVTIVVIPFTESGQVFHMSLEPQISHFINFTLWRIGTNFSQHVKNWYQYVLTFGEKYAVYFHIE